VADATQTAQNILKAIGGALTEVAPLTSGPWRVALGGVGLAVSFVAQLISEGLDPHIAITTLQSALPDYEAAKKRLEELVEKKSK